MRSLLDQSGANGDQVPMGPLGLDLWEYLTQSYSLAANVGCRVEQCVAMAVGGPVSSPGV